MLDLGDVVIGGGKAFAQGLRGGHGLAGTQAKFARRAIHGLQHPALGRAAEQHQRLIGFGTLTQHSVEGQLREQNTHPAHDDLSDPR
ncbi:hypothetical protein PS718_02016 [Pseudomonas fluorescens]|uniref:Uncharacterized protein n=1 Tax=Pseudomonas fluorescens TaxID=294 RepID=A0A5E7BM01_PSEFL|nr:hypothetical protein PS718_02016 [Pseudomonas fluorescens]